MEGPSKGRVIGYAPRIIIENAELIVNKIGRQRVLKEKRKSVHAGCVGQLAGVNSYSVRLDVANLNMTCKTYSNIEWTVDVPYGTAITYNPYLYESVVNKTTKHPVHKAKGVIFSSNHVQFLD